jgi:hypothetical protein
MIELGVFFREFNDSTCEIGVLTIEGDSAWMDVGDFNYLMNWNDFEYPFTWIGFL